MPGFDYSSGNPDNLVGGAPARMQDIQGPFYDIRAYLNSLPSGGGGGGGGGVQVSAQVSEVGQPSQVRAGRQLALSDFTSLGLNAPVGLWNLSDLSDSSGNNRPLTNKGGVTFAGGINGNANTAAQFTGSTGQALYRSDSGAGDPFRILTGSWGCWFRTAKRGQSQQLIIKDNNTTTASSYQLVVEAFNVVTVGGALTTSGYGNVSGVSDVCDDRWHFAVGTFDGMTVRVYVDGVLEAAGLLNGVLNGSAGPLNIGARGADGGSSGMAGLSHYGRVDEAFVTADVLSEDQIRTLYAARIPHTLGAMPKAVSLSVRRARKGVALVTADFTTAPLRLYNMTGPGSAAWNDEGSNGVPLASGAYAAVAGADGKVNGARSYNGAGSDTTTDAGLPSGTNQRSYGCWFKCGFGVDQVIMGWGTQASADVRLYVASAGQLRSLNAASDLVGPFVGDGQWHHAVMVEDNAAGDGVKRRMYLDGRCVAGITTMNAITLAGANRFRIGASPDGTLPFTGQIDGVFVTGYAMTQDELTRLYLKSTQAMPGSPKNAGDHVEAFDSGSVLFIGDTLEGQHSIDLTVS